MTASEPDEPTSDESTAWRGALPTSRRIDPDERASIAVVFALAAAIDADPVELTPPLHSFVDPEALDTIHERGCEDLRIVFDAYGCRVTVEGDLVMVGTLDPGVERSSGGYEGSTDGHEGSSGGHA